MRFLFLAHALFVLSFTAQAQLANPYASSCQFSFQSDSYGRGVEESFTGKNSRARYHDEACYQLGLRTAASALSVGNASRCRADYKSGHREGGVSSLMSSGSECHVLGYAAGKGALGVGAREGRRELVGERCVKLYGKGRADGMAGRPNNPGTTSAKDAYCYQLGHYEGDLAF